MTGIRRKRRFQSRSWPRVMSWQQNKRPSLRRYGKLTKRHFLHSASWASTPRWVTLTHLKRSYCGTKKYAEVTPACGSEVSYNSAFVENSAEIRGAWNNSAKKIGIRREKNTVNKYLSYTNVQTQHYLCWTHTNNMLLAPHPHPPILPSLIFHYTCENSIL